MIDTLPPVLELTLPELGRVYLAGRRSKIMAVLAPGEQSPGNAARFMVWGAGGDDENTAEMVLAKDYDDACSEIAALKDRVAGLLPL